MMSAIEASRRISAFAPRCRLTAVRNPSRNTDRSSERPLVASNPGGGDVPSLLMPEVAVDVAPLQQLAMPADVVYTSALKNENGVRRYQRRQPVRNDDHGATMSNAG